MIRGLYAAASGMLAEQSRLDSVANNLANVSTTGFKRQSIAIHSFREYVDKIAEKPETPLTPPSPANDRLRPVSQSDATAGMMHITGNKTDFAIAGEGYFTVQTPWGEAYTRNGAFTLGPDKRLITADGYAVQGENGPIQIDSTNWQLRPDGELIVNGAAVDRLKIMTLPSVKDAERRGSTLWMSSDAQPAGIIDVRQEYLEGSNVNPVAEMIDMISVTRLFEANQRALQAQDATLDRAVNDIGRV